MTYLQTQSAEKGIQVIVTTHSPNLASAIELDNMVMIHNRRAFSLAKEQTKLETGVIVRGVAPGSPADDAGIQANDVITKIVVKAKDINEKIENMSDLNRVAGKLEGYTKAIAIQIMRGEATQIITLTPAK